jgi:hypothetical protein
MQMARMVGLDMENNKDGGRKIGWQSGNKAAKGLHTTGGRPDYNYVTTQHTRPPSRPLPTATGKTVVLSPEQQ